MIARPLRSLGQFYASSVGKKYVVALTAIALLLFLPAHVIGNLLFFAGPEALNEYAYFLHHMGHGAGVWVFRFGLLAAFVIHIVATVQLARQNRAARAERYAVKTSQRSTLASRTMIVSGLIILAFVVFHILHYTVRVDQGLASLKTMVDGKEGHDVYSMVVIGFENIPVTAFYFIGITLLCTHLAHGVSSVFQTLGLRSRKTASLIEGLGKVYAVAIWLGFLAVPLGVLFKAYNDEDVQRAPVTASAKAAAAQN